MLVSCGVGYCVSVVSLRSLSSDTFIFLLSVEGWLSDSESFVLLD